MTALKLVLLGRAIGELKVLNMNTDWGIVWVYANKPEEY